MSQARHYEMKDSGVEWIGKMPSNWQVKYLFQLASQVKNKNNDLREKNLLSLSYGKIKRKDIETTDGLLPASFDGYNIIEEGDIVMRLTDLQNDHTSLRVGRATERGIITSAYTTVRPSKETYPFLYLALHSFDVKKGFYGMGAGVRQGLNYGEVKKVLVPVPPLSEQTAIAAYLDEKCTTIDAIITETKASIEEYKSWKASVIFEAVTKGLDPNAEMKDSGVEWIGMMPSNWQVKYLFQFVSQVKNKNNDLREKNLLSLSYGKIKRKDIETTDGLLPASFDGYNIIEEGDIVMRLTDLQNDHTSLRVGRATERGIITSAYTTVRPAKETSPFLYLALHSFDVKKGFYGMGAGVRQGLNYGEVKKVLLPFPPANEQQTIVAYLNEKCAVIDSIITEKEALIGELETYKKSLIFETVTGKRRVC